MPSKPALAFGRRSLRGQLTMLALITGVIAVGLTVTGLIIYEVVWFRGQLVSRAASIGDILGSNIAAALAFENRADVEESLAALGSERSIVGAYVFDSRRDFVAGYRRSDRRVNERQPDSLADVRKNWLGLTAFRTIRLDHDVVGYIGIESDLSPLYVRVRDYSSITLLIVLLSLAVAYAVSRRMQAVISEPLLQLKTAARHVWLHRDYAVRVPVGASDEVGAVMNAFNDMLQEIQHRDRQLSESTAQLKEAKALLEERVISRTRELEEAQRLLTENLERLDLALEGAEEALWDWHVAENRTYYDEYWPRMLGYSREEIGESVEVWEKLVHPDDLEAVKTKLRAHLEGQTERYQTEYRMRAKDGGWRWIRARGKVVARAADGSPLRVTGTHVDITAHKQAQDALIRLTREAGMAEVATSVLHNVGNVLNSVNVSATLAADRIRDLSLNRLSSVVSLLEGHHHDLSEFLSRDQRGVRVISYLAKLGQLLEQERQVAIRELNLVRDHVGHIKQIVSAQQGLARVSGVKENTSLAALAEQVSQILAPGLERNGIRFEVEVGTIPEVSVDKHQILQILLNLLRNAEDAVREKAGGERRIRLRIYRHGGNRVRFEVKDTGVGLHPDQLARVFAHGYTTKRDGHGFGLHSCSLYASQMRGSLWGESDGPGLGATFILEIPLKEIPEEGAG
ncbi:MAG: PAS domain-containing protein [Bryobacteraceae bacterium]